MIISFNGEAYETYQRLVSALQGYTVEIVTEDDETFDAKLLGPDTDSEWGDAVRYQKWSDDDPDVEFNAAVESARVKSIYVY